MRSRLIIHETVGLYGCPVPLISTLHYLYIIANTDMVGLNCISRKLQDWMWSFISKIIV